MTLDLDDLIEDVTPEPVETELVTPAAFTITYDPDEEVGVATLPTKAVVTGMVAHNQHLYIITANGRVFRSEVRFRDRRNKWEEIELPEEV